MATDQLFDLAPLAPFTATFDLNGKLAESGPQLLTFRYGKGNNFGYFEFEPVEPLPAAKP